MLNVHEKFTRGPGPLLSVLIPTRGRPRQLWDAVDSLLRGMEDPRQIEFLLKCDDDDQPTLDMLERLGEGLKQHGSCLKVDISPRGRGYADIGTHLDYLASQSCGDFIVNWIDDARLLTAPLDTYFANLPGGWKDGIYGLIFRREDRPEHHELMAVRREVFDILGNLSIDGGPAYDTTMFAVLCAIDRIGFTSHIFRHEQVADDQTFLDHAAMKPGSAAWDIARSCNDPVLLRKRLDAAAKLLDRMPPWSGACLGAPSQPLPAPTPANFTVSHPPPVVTEDARSLPAQPAGRPRSSAALRNPLRPAMV